MGKTNRLISIIVVVLAPDELYYKGAGTTLFKKFYGREKMLLSHVILAIASFVLLIFIILLIRFIFENRNNIPDCSLEEARERYKKNREATFRLIGSGIVATIIGYFIFGTIIPLYQFILVMGIILLFVVLDAFYHYQAMRLARRRVQYLLSLEQEKQ